MRPPDVTDNYDPVKAHQYYERTKQLKGRKPAKAAPIKARPAAPKKVVPPPKTAEQIKKEEAVARVGRLRANLDKLKGALAEAEQELSKRRQKAAQSEKKNSDGKTTAAERLASKKYRDKNQSKIAESRKKSAESSSSPDGKSVQDLTTPQLEDRIQKIKTTITDAENQLANANKELGQLAHSSIMSMPNINEYFTQFLQSAERIPSQ